MDGSAEFHCVTGSEVPEILRKTGLHCYRSIQLCSHGLKWGKYNLRKIRVLRHPSGVNVLQVLQT